MCPGDSKGLQPDDCEPSAGETKLFQQLAEGRARVRSLREGTDIRMRVEGENSTETAMQQGRTVGIRNIVPSAEHEHTARLLQEFSNATLL